MVNRYSILTAPSGFTVAEVVIAMGAAVLIGTGVIFGLEMCERFAADARLLTNARSIVERNIDQALKVSFTSANTPALLATTGTAGVLYNDGYPSATPYPSPYTNLPLEPIAFARSNNNSVTMVSGSLTRMVVPYPNPSGPNNVLQVSFRVDYVYRSRPYSFSLVTLRARDD